MSEALILVDMGMFIFWVMAGICLFIAVISAVTPRRSQEYRKTLADMYVAAKIKLLATKDGLDIAKEFESFKKWSKNQNLAEKDLDNVIERDLKEKVAEPKEAKKKPDQQ